MLTGRWNVGRTPGSGASVLSDTSATTYRRWRTSILCPGEGDLASGMLTPGALEGCAAQRVPPMAKTGSWLIMKGFGRIPYQMQRKFAIENSMLLIG